MMSTACITEAAPPSFPKGGTILINQIVTRDSMRPVSQFLLTGLAAKTLPNRITMIINSPGGSVRAGFQFISIMKEVKSRGIRIDCVVPSLAASMAFHFLMHCDTRSVLAESGLLWHRARVQLGGGMFSEPTLLTAPIAAILSRDLQETDDHIISDLIRTIGASMSLVDMMSHFEAETMHLGEALCNRKTKNFCTSYDAIPGLYDVFTDRSIIRAAEPTAMNLFEDRDLVYIYTGSRSSEFSVGGDK